MSQVRLDLIGCVSPVEKKGITSKPVRKVGTSSAIFSTTERARGKYEMGIGIRKEFGCKTHA